MAPKRSSSAMSSPAADAKDSAPKMKKPKIIELCAGEIVDVVVEGKVYRVHKQLLVSKVPYFETRLKDCWDKGQNRVELQDAKADTFAFFLEWLYTDTICYKDILYIADDKTQYLDMRMLTSLYRLADQMMCCKLKNDIVDACQKRSETERIIWNFIGLQGVVEELDAGMFQNNLFDLVLYSAVGNFMRRDKPTTEVDMPGFGKLKLDSSQHLKLLRMVWEYQKKPWQFWEACDKCRFHDHTDGSKCV